MSNGQFYCNYIIVITNNYYLKSCETVIEVRPRNLSFIIMILSMVSQFKINNH